MTAKHAQPISYERASRAAALADLLNQYLLEGTEPGGDRQVDPDTLCLGVQMLHELLDTPESWEGVRNAEEEAYRNDIAARRAVVGGAA